MPLHGETSGGEEGRKIWLTSRYMTTTWLIFILRCWDCHSGVQNVAHKCWATSRGFMPSAFLVEEASVRGLFIARSKA